MEKYRDASLSVPERVEDLLSKMTLEEKIAQLCGDLPSAFITDGQVDMEKLRNNYPLGHGRFTQFSLMGLADPQQIATNANLIQRYFVEETRLGIPVAFQSENLCGYPSRGGTLFPAMINMGSTWEPELAEKMAEIIGKECRDVGISSAMSPVLDVAQDPRWGRTYECFGEDPYHISQFGIGYVRGMQKQGVSCIAKHFLGYSSTQGGLNTAACRMGRRELYEIFATPFEAADKEAGLGSVMCNYGEIDGIPVVANSEIIEGLLRTTMGFKGAVTTDGAALLKNNNFFHTASTYEEAGYLAKKAGTDTEIPVGAAFKQLGKYVRSGQLSEKCIDDSVRRILTIKFNMGLFENPYCSGEAAELINQAAYKDELSEEIAAKSVIMLKNDGILPLSKGTKVAVIGPHADSLRYPVSGYTYPAYIEMLNAGVVGGPVSFNGIADEQAKLDEEKVDEGPFAKLYSIFTDSDKAKMGNMVDVLRAMHCRSLYEELSDRFETSYAQGCDIIAMDEDGFAEAVETARNADVVVFACGGNSGWVNVTGGEGKDRQFLDLPGVQQKLLEAISAVNKNVVVVLYGPGIFAVNWAAKHCSAILEAYMPGQFAGKALSDILDGSKNPGGKLTMTIPRSTGQIPLNYNHRVGSGYRGSFDATVADVFTGGYVDGPADPLYCFGHGLSYTSFELSNLCLNAEEIRTDGRLEISCTIKNTGIREGDEVVQLYTRTHGAHVTRPNIQLSGFKRITLQPNEEKKLRFDLEMSQLGYFNEDMDFVFEPCKLDIMIGSSCDDLPLKSEVNVIGEKVELLGRRSYVCETNVF